MGYRENIIRLRKQAHLRQKDIATIIGTSQTMYGRYERGINEMPIHHLVNLCKYYRVSSDSVLGLDKPQQPGVKKED